MSAPTAGCDDRSVAWALYLLDHYGPSWEGQLGEVELGDRWQEFLGLDLRRCAVCEGLHWDFDERGRCGQCVELRICPGCGAECISNELCSRCEREGR